MSEAGESGRPASCSGDAYDTIGDDASPSAAERNPEVVQVGVAVTIDEDVLRLDVAVDHAAAVGGPQGAGDLTEHRRGAIRGQRAEPEGVGQAAGVDETHDEVGGAGFAPVVVERDDVRVLESGDQLGLRFEAADERRVVGQLGTDDLDRHLPADDRLVGAVDRTEGAASELLAHLVAADRQPGRTSRPGRGEEQLAVVEEDLVLQVAHGARRLDPHLHHEPLPERRAGAKRLGGATAAVERQHQRGEQPLP